MLAVEEYAHEVLPLVEGVHHGYVYLELAAPHAGVDLVSVSAQLVGHGVDDAVGLLCRLYLSGGNGHAPVLGKLQEALQPLHAAGVAAPQVYLLGLQG